MSKTILEMQQRLITLAVLGLLPIFLFSIARLLIHGGIAPEKVKNSWAIVAPAILPIITSSLVSYTAAHHVQLRNKQGDTWFYRLTFWNLVVYLVALSLTFVGYALTSDFAGERLDNLKVAVSIIHRIQAVIVSTCIVSF